jgi:hypothetical protein
MTFQGCDFSYLWHAPNFDDPTPGTTETKETNNYLLKKKHEGT